MATQSRQKNKFNTSRTLNFEDFELRGTMQEFLQDEPKSNDGVLNFATISGFAILFIALTFILQLLGLSIGPDLSDVVEILPLIGGVLVTLVGFGFFVGDRQKEEKSKSSGSSKSRSDSYKYDVHGSEVDFGTSSHSGSSGISNHLNDFEQFAPKSSASDRGFSDRTYIDPYGYKKSRAENRKLYKSRTDKKISGVCGGLAKYFGISSTAVRLLAVLATFMWGTSIIIYIGLAIAMPKEPYDLIDDLDY